MDPCETEGLLAGTLSHHLRPRREAAPLVHPDERSPPAMSQVVGLAGAKPFWDPRHPA